MSEKQISLREYARRTTQRLKAKSGAADRRRERLHGITDPGHPRKKARDKTAAKKPEGRRLESGAGRENDIEDLAEEIKGARGIRSGDALGLRPGDGGGLISISEDTQSRLLDLIDEKRRRQAAGME
ncbi:hypothetical protein ES703_112848 [subsurface metagenome]